MPEGRADLTSGGLLVGNALWNMLGFGLPLLAAVAAVPILIETLGTERFGVLTLVWMVAGYFSLFDLGLGRSLTKLVAEKLGHGKKEEIPPLFWTALSIMMVLGVTGAIFVFSLSPWLVHRLLEVPAHLLNETQAAFWLMAFSLPVVIGTTGLRGFLEANQRFGCVNAIRIPAGVLTFIGPLAVLPFSSSLVPIVGVLITCKVGSCLAYAGFCHRVTPTLYRAIQVDRGSIIPLLRFGGWMTITNVIGPVMVYFDRFLIGAVVSMSAVAFYAAPYEIVTKLWIFPSAIMGVVFPAFATALEQNRTAVRQLYDRTITYISLALFPIVLVVVTFGHEGLLIWVGKTFAEKSSLVLQLLAVGVFVNSLAFVPFGLVQSAGRPDWTAKLHILELPIYLLLLWWLLSIYGIVGAAAAWLVRVSIDALILFVMAHCVLPEKTAFSLRTVLFWALGMLALVFGGILTETSTKLWFLFLTLLVFSTTTWFFLLDADFKSWVRLMLKKRSFFPLRWSGHDNH